MWFHRHTIFDRARWQQESRNTFFLNTCSILDDQLYENAKRHLQSVAVEKVWRAFFYRCVLIAEGALSRRFRIIYVTKKNIYISEDKYKEMYGQGDSY